MPVRIFTIPFSEESQTFHDDLVYQFCLNKRIHRVQVPVQTQLHAARHGLRFLGRRIFPATVRHSEGRCPIANVCRPCGASLFSWATGDASSFIGM